MKTTLNIPEALLKTAMTLSKNKTKTGTVIVALEDYVRKKRIEKILEHQGKLQFEEIWEKSRHAR
ncbi:MAG: type II toxin-antitoxin system VapB family antitoxin [Thermodesulfobacteriota bacterium]